MKKVDVLCTPALKSHSLTRFYDAVDRPSPRERTFENDSDGLIYRNRGGSRCADPAGNPSPDPGD